MMHEWFEEASWHAPSLLVLDNLDKMIVAEQEVSQRALVVFVRGKAD